MDQITIRISAELREKIEEEAEEKDVSKSEVARNRLEMGFDYDQLQNKVDRLESEKQMIIQDREEKQELVKFAEKQKSILEKREERRNMPVWKRAKHWILGKNNHE